MKEENIFALLYILTIFLFFFVCFWRTCHTTDDTLISNDELNQIQMSNDRHAINSNRQNSSIPLNVLNDLEYENIYNPSYAQPRQPHNAAQSSRINVSTPQATTVPLSSSLNYAELNTSNFASFSRFLLDDPPPSYEECMARSCPTSRFIHSY
ncbi:uncharacterized protein LOC113548516 isoform X1 [Rhopalosiphum maidis]|uniref:uncharacterized protein LOC113548516 isoform X1 n=1 Tax=Rhopalosiphum maidis TaxID=43146 RepID=UPI000EFFAEF2|nr:uncharacterized protein LOC113548516 isoform X1 [Rhopalosiphum maidis]XP_026805244.1 uncharacterized protein LOC113548516 isoform X1 [Rhopalosiphum maidis]XP_026805245.1 uncharacterized protein LOC113548516 isoform X1 [Rhopalosiphum maidis]